jgi:hypothetical protein
MEIIRHLSNEELADLVIDSDQKAVRQILDTLPGLAHAATQQNEEFWRKQRTAVWSRISSAEDQSRRRLAIVAGALAAVVVSVSGWLVNRPFEAPPRQGRLDSDHELLLEVERAVQIEGPLALEPAALLAEEMVQDLPAKNSPSHKKEPGHEN